MDRNKEHTNTNFMKNIIQTLIYLAFQRYLDKCITTLMSGKLIYGKTLLHLQFQLDTVVPQTLRFRKNCLI